VSRYSYDGDEAMTYGLWEANAQRALSGKRGKQALRDLREALLALPEPVLIEGALCTVNPQLRNDQYGEVSEHGEGVCAIGAYLWHKRVKAGMGPAEAFDSLPTLLDDDSEMYDTAVLAQAEGGITFTLAWELAYRNDETYARMTPEQRYMAFLTWIDEQLDETEEAQ
jgi:hypothetical protein